MNKEKQQELINICQQMQQISNRFYDEARRLNNHAFIEFTGLMNEYIILCQNAIKEDIDFTECNTHTGKPLPFEQHHKDYLKEKLDCIYGQSLKLLNNQTIPPVEVSTPNEIEYKDLTRIILNIPPEDFEDFRIKQLKEYQQTLLSILEEEIPNFDSGERVNYEDIEGWYLSLTTNLM